MEVTVSGRHTTVSEALRQAAVEKISRLSRFTNGESRAEVHFSEAKNPRISEKEICEVTLEVQGHHIRSRVQATDPFTAIDLVVDKLERQLRKLKTRQQRRRNSGEKIALPPALAPDSLIDDGIDAPVTTYDIVKVKRFDLIPMDPQDAALRMDLLGHDFYLFMNSQTDTASVVYRRDDGDIGLIEAA